MAEASTSQRRDGRTDTSLRPLSLSSGVLSRADGSSRFAFGPVEVLASVNGPQEVRLRDELLDRATLEVNVLPVRGLPGPLDAAPLSSLCGP
jgi:exosome complex component RRP46